MSPLFQDISIEQNAFKVKYLSASEFYDKYAGMLYGHVYEQFESEVLTERILKEVFVELFSVPNYKVPNNLTSLCALIHLANKKSLKFKKALALFVECRVC